MTIAEELAKQQKEISVAEFFEKNRHLLGFDSKRKALLMTIKEAVDNALDACEEADVLPEIFVELIDMGNDRFRAIIEDNGPGIVKKQIPKIFAKLLYGSKFHRLKMSRGQQGIGISAAVLYSQLTTGRAVKITSRTGKGKPAHYYELHIDTKKNEPEIIKEEEVEWEKDNGTRIELDLEGVYQKGAQSVDEYIKQTAIVNPHTTIIYTNPKAEQIICARATDKKPEPAKEIKPHPYGVELGLLSRMMKDTESRTLQSFLTNEFSRVGSGTAKEICENAKLLPSTKPKEMTREQVEHLIKGIRATKIMSPPTDCVVPIGANLLETGLKKEIKAEFYTTITRTPAVYRGNPFIIEIGIAYGGEIPAEGSVNILRFANKVPLLYQQGACAITDAITSTNWRPYGIQQSTGSIPQGPALILVHMASVWVPFTSESKEAIAHYSEIIKEIKLALQECGRKLASYVRKKKLLKAETDKRSYIEKYIPHVSSALQELLGFSKSEEEKTENLLKSILEKHRGKLEAIEMENLEYDEELAAIGAEGESEEENAGKDKEE